MGDFDHLNLLTGEDETVAQRYSALRFSSPGWPGDWNFADLERFMAISAAELARNEAELALWQEIDEAFARGCPRTTGAARLEMTVQEVLACARRVMPDVYGRIAALPRPDRAGMLWWIHEIEEAQRNGTLISLPHRQDG